MGLLASRELCVCAVHRGSDVSDVHCHNVTLTYIRLDYLCLSTFSSSAVGSNTLPVLSSRSLTTEYQFLIPIIFRSSSTSSVHLLRGLPLFLILPFYQFFLHSFVIHHSIMSYRPNLTASIRCKCVPLIMFPVCPYLLLL